jgi:arginyl-tRNA synthetase
MKEALQQLISQTITSLIEAEKIPAIPLPFIKVERTRDASHGDLACNIALVLAKPAAMKPRDIAELICETLPANSVIASTDIAGPGFINFFLAKSAQTDVVSQVLTEAEQFGHNKKGLDDNGKAKTVQVEFVSANPTGPLHVGHGRGAAVGDSICRLLDASGWQVTREFYYNDAGQQINNLTRSVQMRCKGIGPDHADWPENGYRGEYISELAADYMAGKALEDAAAPADADNDEAICNYAVAYLRREQDIDLKAFGVEFDVFSLESSLYTEGKVESTVNTLIKNGFTYEKDDALWLKTTEFGDDKDRVMRKSDGGYTYFVPDVAYHHEKWKRGFNTVVNEQGADHHSTITRVRAGLQALNAGIPQGWPDYVLHQMVTVMRDGQEVKISKRAGSYVTLSDLIEQVGRDATRYFLVARRADSQLTFDIDLALQKSNDNPVFYIQYAHARVCSVMRQAIEKNITWDKNAGLDHLDKLTTDTEVALLKSIAAYPECVALSAREFAPHNIAAYLRDLSAALHSWYASGNQDKSSQLLVADADIRNARLALAEAARQVIANGLSLLGVSAPEKM